MNDKVCLDEPLTAKQWTDGMTLAEDPSEKLRPKKFDSQYVGQSTPHTVTIDVDGFHNVVAVDIVTLAKAGNGVG